MKTINEDEIDYIEQYEWQCPYVKCGNYNTEHGYLPDYITCFQCKKKIKVIK